MPSPLLWCSDVVGEGAESAQEQAAAGEMAEDTAYDGGSGVAGEEVAADP